MERQSASKKVVRKTVAHFKCTSESCSKTWTSVHGWASRRVNCDICQGKANIENFIDEQCELDTYNCPQCENQWQCIHDPETTTGLCDICPDVEVTKEPRTQNRYGRHYFYKCTKRNCGIRWEDFYFGKIFTQRCKTCYAAGLMTKTTTGAAINKGRRPFSAGAAHDIDGCDMCQELRSQGVSNSCRRKKTVVFTPAVDPNEFGRIVQAN